MAERIILDPSEVATGRTELDITPWIRADDGVDWGSGEIVAYMAEAERGQVPVDFRVPNRQVQVPLVLQERGGTAFATFRSLVQAKAALFQRQGGWVKRVTSSGGTVFADVVNASLGLPGSWTQAHKDYDIGSSLSLECIPDFYGAEVDLGDNVETTATELIFTETGITGDYPGRCRIVVDEDDAETQLGLIWGIRSRYYSAASTARLTYQAESLTTLDAAATTNATGASGGAPNAVQHASLSTNWTPVLSTQDDASGAHMTHTGTYRVWVRASTSSATPPELRLVWDVGDLTLPVENAPVALPAAGNNWYALDLGEVRLDAPPIGTHRWQGQIQARGAFGGEYVALDKVWFAPVDEGYGVLRAPISVETVLVDYSARDEFNQTAGDLTGKTAAVGGTWAEAGDVDGFVVETTGKTAQRTAVSDTEAHFALCGLAAYSRIAVQADVKWSVVGTGVSMGVFARYSGTTDHVMAFVNPSSELFAISRQSSAGVFDHYGAVTVTFATDTWYTIRLVGDTIGRMWAWIWPRGGSAGAPQVVVQHSEFATGGVRDDGRIGVMDIRGGADASTRSIDNFAAWVPTLDAVLHASQSAEVSTDGMFREDSAGVAYGPVSHVVGDLPRIPPGGTTEFFLKASRGDLDQIPDSGIDDISARVIYRPSWLFVPGS